MRTLVTRSLAVLAFAACTLPVGAQDAVPPPIDRVRQLYESAAYDDALTAIADIAPSPGSTVLERATDLAILLRYRALCLLALDRSVEADLVVEQLMMADPAYWPDANETSPRFVSSVDRARNRVLPQLARAQYESAKKDFDEKRHAEAAAKFTRVMTLLDQPGLDRSLLGSTGDLRMLAKGFLELTRTPAAPPPPSAASPTVTPIYTAADHTVVPPVTVMQELPPWSPVWSPTIKGLFEGLIEVIIDERGRVESAALQETVFPAYNKLAVAGAKDWRYAPATRGGVPVKFRKPVLIRLTIK